MNIEMIANIAKKNPALARMLNLAVISLAVAFFTGLVNFLSTGEVINLNIIFMAGIMPILWGLEKLQRDINNMDE